MTDLGQSTNKELQNVERRLPALAVSRGIGIGKVVFLQGERQPFARLNLNNAQVVSELERFRKALRLAIADLRTIAGNVEDQQNALNPAAEIFGVHLLILESTFSENIESVISDRRVAAEAAISAVAEKYRERQKSIDNESFRDRYLDIEDVAGRLLTALNGTDYSGSNPRDAIIVARELHPSKVVELSSTKPAAFITEHGGWTSHSSILAREFGIPMVSGVRNLEQFASVGDEIIVDGQDGEVILNPGTDTIGRYRSQANTIAAPQDAVNHRDGKCVTLDGIAITIRANIDLPDAYSNLQTNSAEGIGLFRSESLIRRKGQIPSEEDQFDIYCRIGAASGAAGVRIRTFDIGVDELYGNEDSSERNPSLGLRAIRLSLSKPDFFRIQIRALLRASFEKKMEIILPMISGVSEVLRAKVMIEQERLKLENEGHAAGNPKIGAMIETPSAVVTAAEIAQNVDFLCLGTNDLVQYLLAVDRDNESVADWYQTLHPAVISAITLVFSSASAAGVPVTVCGEMAGSAFYLPVLIGLGARDLSMNVNSIQPIRRLLSGISTEQTRVLTEQIKSLQTAEEIEILLRDYYLEHFSDLFPKGVLNSRYR